MSAHKRTPWLRWYILRTLLQKEVRRHLANRGGIALVLLLIVASLLLSVTGNGDGGGGPSLVGGVKRCYIDYWERDDWIVHLMDHVPPELAEQVRFRNAPSRAPTAA